MHEVGQNLEKKRKEGISLINKTIGELRSNYITVIPGQEMLYLKKEEEARRYILDSVPNLADYPLISAEIGLTGVTASDVANTWIYMSNQWAIVASTLESIRLGHIYQLEAATSVSAINAILVNFNLALEQLPS